MMNPSIPVLISVAVLLSSACSKPKQHSLDKANCAVLGRVAAVAEQTYATAGDESRSMAMLAAVVRTTGGDTTLNDPEPADRAAVIAKDAIMRHRRASDAACETARLLVETVGGATSRNATARLRAAAGALTYAVCPELGESVASSPETGEQHWGPRMAEFRKRAIVLRATCDELAPGWNSAAIADQGKASHADSAVFCRPLRGLAQSFGDVMDRMDGALHQAERAASHAATSATAATDGEQGADDEYWGQARRTAIGESSRAQGYCSGAKLFQELIGEFAVATKQASLAATVASVAALDCGCVNGIASQEQVVAADSESCRRSLKLQRESADTVYAQLVNTCASEFGESGL